MMLILRNDHFVGELVSTAVHIRGKGGRVTEMVIQSRYVSLTLNKDEARPLNIKVAQFENK